MAKGKKNKRIASHLRRKPLPPLLEEKIGCGADNASADDEFGNKNVLLKRNPADCQSIDCQIDCIDEIINSFSVPGKQESNGEELPAAGKCVYHVPVDQAWLSSALRTNFHGDPNAMELMKILFKSKLMGDTHGISISIRVEGINEEIVERGADMLEAIMGNMKRKMDENEHKSGTDEENETTARPAEGNSNTGWADWWIPTKNAREKQKGAHNVTKIDDDGAKMQWQPQKQQYRNIHHHQEGNSNTGWASPAPDCWPAPTKNAREKQKGAHNVNKIDDDGAKMQWQPQRQQYRNIHHHQDGIDANKTAKNKLSSHFGTLCEIQQANKEAAAEAEVEKEDAPELIYPNKTVKNKFAILAAANEIQKAPKPAAKAKEAATNFLAKVEVPPDLVQSILKEVNVHGSGMEICHTAEGVLKVIGPNKKKVQKCALKVQAAVKRELDREMMEKQQEEEQEKVRKLAKQHYWENRNKQWMEEWQEEEEQVSCTEWGPYFGDIVDEHEDIDPWAYGIEYPYYDHYEVDDDVPAPVPFPGECFNCGEYGHSYVDCDTYEAGGSGTNANNYGGAGGYGGLARRDDVKIAPFRRKKKNPKKRERQFLEK